MKGAIVLPALDTVFIGVNDSPGVWSERCRACGSCRLHLTAGVCTVTRCSKGLMNGPCGGSWDGRCELSREIPCAWCEIWDRLKARGETFRYVSPPPRDWSAGFPGGPRRLDREEMK
jgi:hypothetical protein